MIIAIDGHSSCGKSTIAKTLAKELDFLYVDTGAMYRAVTLYCIQHNLIDTNQVQEEDLRHHMSQISISFQQVENSEFSEQKTYLNGVCVEKEIRGIEVSNQVSVVSTLDFVRQKLVEMQREYAAKNNMVMDGRDIGTVVFPHADYKFFVTASVEVRAQRRYNELIAKGEQVSFEEISANIEKRDFIDSTRKESPLRQADDAIVLDNSAMTRKEQMEWILQRIKI
ncbi:MAG: (d)CMP kinase [Bacteroidales bacterium]|jgi:cytidylate kinase|nr:(d)CMP kinase [Bacteroidales bacterium]